MNWWVFAGSIVNKIPIERLLFPPRDKTKALEEFAATMTASVAQNKAPPVQRATPTTPRESETAPQREDVAVACVPCALGHFSRSAGALEEAKRFQHEGITSNEILDRVADVIKEQNTLERYDLTPMKLQNSPEWERELAEEALEESRQLRHLLEGFTDMKQLEAAAARAATFYKRLNREWFRQRFAHLGPEKAQSIADKVGKLSSKEQAQALKRAEELVEEAR